MRFEVKYPSGQPHEVELSGSVAVLGRDPSCDLVLNDGRCSRRHAVLEAGPQGISIRDAGSANGVFVNGKKTERAQLVDGDVVRLGEVFLTVLPEEVAGTVVMAPEDLQAVEQVRKPADDERTGSLRPRLVEQLATSAPAPPSMPAPAPSSSPLPRVPTPAPSAAQVSTAPATAPPPLPTPRPPAPPRPAPPPRPATRPPSGGAIGRPLTVTLLAVLWMIGILYYPIVTVFSLRSVGGVGAVLLGAVGVLATLVSGLLAWGLWTRQGWARFAQIAAAIFGLLSCVFAPACGAILAYLFRADVQGHFGDTRPSGPGAGENGRLEPYFAGAIAGLIVLPLLLLLLLALVGAFASPMAGSNQ